VRKPFFQSSRQSNKANGRQSPARKRRIYPHVEPLEGRIVLSTFQVNTTLDTVAVNLHTGKDNTGHVSLRSAIMAADAHGGSDTIKLKSGLFKLTMPGANEDASASGDLDITGPLTIKGAGPGQTIVDGNNLDRVFDILGGKVSITGLTVQHGLSDNGGGIRNDGGRVTLSSVVVTQNEAVGSSGASGAQGMGGGLVGANGTDGVSGSDGHGGGIFNEAGSIAISNSTISSNQAIGGDGGQGGAGVAGQGSGAAGASSLDGTGGAGGNAGVGGSGSGAGIYNAVGATLTLSSTTISFNRAQGGLGGEGGIGGVGTGAQGPASAPQASGDGIGGDGGQSGLGGNADGGGLYNAGDVVLQKSTNTFEQNLAVGGDGGVGGTGGMGNGSAGNDGAAGGTGNIAGNSTGGTGGTGGLAGNGKGGGLFNDSGGVFVSTAPANFIANLAAGGTGGAAGTGGPATGASGGTGNGSGNGGKGGLAEGGNGGTSSLAGNGQGGAIFNEMKATLTIRAKNKGAKTPASIFSGNRALGGSGGAGGQGGMGTGGSGGAGGPHGDGGAGGAGRGGIGSTGGVPGGGEGGALDNFGKAMFTGITVQFLNNQANGSEGGRGGDGGTGSGGQGGIGVDGGNGFTGAGGDGGKGQFGDGGIGGAIDNEFFALLVIAPRENTSKGSRQSHAVDSITGNEVNGAPGGAGGAGGRGIGGPGMSPGGFAGQSIPGKAGAAGAADSGSGGGLILDPQGTAIIDNTNITGNTAAGSENDVDGSFSS
jgi:hypothetical protein